MAAPASLAPGPGGPQAPPATAGVTTGPDSISLVSQSTWVGPGGELALHLRIGARHPAQEALAVLVYGALSARSQFQAALKGNVVGGPIFNPPAVPLSSLVADRTGGVDIDVAIGQPAGGLDWPPSTTGVYPVQLFLENAARVRVGPLLSTFLVYADKSAAHLQRLRVSVVVPFVARVPISPSGRPGPVPAQPASLLEGDAAAIARWQAPLTLGPDISTLAALQKGTPAARKALAEVQAAVASGDQVLPGADLPISLGAFEASGFAGDLSAEVTTGLSALKGFFGFAPSTRTWALLSDVGPSTVLAAMSLGGSRFVLPADDLTGLPASNQELTFAQPTGLEVARRHAVALGADSELSSRVRQAGSGAAVLVGYQVLAELAMIDLERPNDIRGVVVMPPTGVIIDPGFLSVLLAGLQANPLLDSVTVRELFSQVPLATTAGGGRVVLSLATQRPASPVQGVGQLLTARAALHADAEVYGPEVPAVEQLSNSLIVSLSSWFSPSQRAAVIGRALAEALADLHDLHLPPPTSITLTSRQGQLPLTLTANGPGPMRVLLVLRSEQLGFATRHYAEGTCRAPTPGTEDCLLTLDHTVTLDVPVVVRSTGAFPVSLSVETPDGSQVIASRTDYVRSTAFSDVGLALMVAAALFLAVWWARNARHGRRARKLVPRPDEEEPVETPVVREASPV